MRCKTMLVALCAIGAIGLAGCSGGDTDGGAGGTTDGGSDPNAWLSENCAVTLDGSDYPVGVGYALTDYTLYEYTREAGTAFISETTLPAETRVCFDQTAGVETEDADGSGTLQLVPVAWSEQPEGFFIKRDGYGGDHQVMCNMNTETTASCVGDENYFQLDPELSAELAD